jgi:arginase
MTSRTRRPLSFLGAPSSAGAFSIGQEDAPAALRELRLLERLGEAGVAVDDLGDLPLRRWRPDRDSPRAQNIAEVTANAAAVRDRVGGALRDPRSRILVLGGDCTTGVGTLAGATVAIGNRPAWIYFDLHADLNTPVSVGAGALDWMGMAHALALPGTIPAFRDLAGPEPLTTPEHISLLAHEWKTATEWEREQLQKLALRRIACDEVATDPVGAAEKVLRVIESTRPVVLHFDVDVINFIDAPLSENDGRETGLQLQNALAALTTLLADARVRALTVTELNPHHAAADPEALPTFVSGLIKALSQ